MIILPLVFGLLVANPSHPQSVPFLEAMYQEFDPNIVPKLYQIALCESSLNQWNENGDPLVSPTDDYGILQINGTHTIEAEKLGLDFKHSIVDNVKMAKVVYEKQGLGAWTCARKLGITET